MHSLTGLWTGTLTYGKAYGSDAGKELNFEFRLHQQGNEIVGTAIDKEGFLRNNSIADIEGTMDGDEFTFVKQYRTVRYPELFTGEIEGPEIFYSGKFDVASQQIQGKWVIKAHYIEGAGQCWATQESDGEWFVKRIV